MKAKRAGVASGFVVLVFVGCGGQQPGQRTHDGASANGRSAGDEAMQNKVGSRNHRRAVIAQADRALRQRWPLDYRRPFIDEPYREDALQRLYIEGCRTGDKRSCWMAAMLDGWSPSGAATKQMIENCVAGDVMSCRAVPRRLDRGHGDNKPGSVGRSSACTYPDPDNGCDVTALRQECTEGFPDSCMDLSLAATDTDKDMLEERVRVLARAGCESGIKAECELVRRTGHGKDDFVFSQLHLCILDISWCDSFDLRERGDLAGARDSDERACQYPRDRTFCVGLGQKYLEGVYEEPVPGRGNALLTWACNDEFMQKYERTCKARAAGNAALRPASP